MKIIKILPLLIIFALLSCENDKKNDAAIENKTFVEKYFSYFNAHDFENMAAMYHDTANFKDPSLGTTLVKQNGKQIIKKYSELNAIFPDLKDSLVATYPSGNEHIVVEFVSSGTGPDKVKFKLPICTIFKIVNGKIVEDFTYFDNFEESK